MPPRCSFLSAPAIWYASRFRHAIRTVSRAVCVARETFITATVVFVAQNKGMFFAARYERRGVCSNATSPSVFKS